MLASRAYQDDQDLTDKVTLYIFNHRIHREYQSKIARATTLSKAPRKAKEAENRLTLRQNRRVSRNDIGGMGVICQSLIID